MVTYLHTYLLYGAESFLRSYFFAACQEIPHISRNPKVHYRTHKRPPPVSILGQPNPVLIPTSHLLEIYPNIIHPSTPRSPQWFLPSGFPTKTLCVPLSSPIHATKDDYISTKCKADMFSSQTTIKTFRISSSFSH